MTFGEALTHLQEGKRIRRKTWGHVVLVYVKDKLFYWPHSAIAIRSWSLEVEDLFADGWEVV